MSSTLERATLHAPDISCGHCVTAIHNAVGALTGVQTVRADERTKHVHVEYDPGTVALAQIEAAMDEEGYPVKK